MMLLVDMPMMVDIRTVLVVAVPLILAIFAISFIEGWKNGYDEARDLYMNLSKYLKDDKKDGEQE